VQLQTSSGSFASTVNRMLVVGLRSASLVGDDRCPGHDARSVRFPNISNQPLGTWVVSAPVQITGITGNVATSIVGVGGVPVGYRICYDPELLE